MFFSSWWRCCGTYPGGAEQVLPAPRRHACVLCSLSGNILIWCLCFYKTGQDLFCPWAICASTCSQITVMMRENCRQITKWKFLNARLWSSGLDLTWKTYLKNTCVMSQNPLLADFDCSLIHIHFSFWKYFLFYHCYQISALICSRVESPCMAQRNVLSLCFLQDHFTMQKQTTATN